MTPLRTAAIALALLLCAGCSGGHSKDAATDPAPVSASVRVSGCEKPLAFVTERSESPATATAVSRFDPDADAPRTLLDDHVSAEVTWTKKPAWAGSDGVLDSIQRASGQPVTGDAGTVEDVDRFLQGVEKSSSTIGFAAVDPLDVTLVVTCANAPRAEAILHTWTKPEVGAMTCGRPLPSTAGPAAKNVYRTYCT